VALNSTYQRRFIYEQWSIRYRIELLHICFVFRHLIEIGCQRQLTTQLYDKQNDLNFSIVNFPYLCSNIPSSPAHGVYISQLIRYARFWLRIVPFTWSGNRAHGGCDQSTGDAYSSMAPDPTSGITIPKVCVCPILWFVFPTGLMRSMTNRYLCHFHISNCTKHSRINPIPDTVALL
jgi:hypothetical protein